MKNHPLKRNSGIDWQARYDAAAAALRAAAPVLAYRAHVAEDILSGRISDDLARLAARYGHREMILAVTGG